MGFFKIIQNVLRNPEDIDLILVPGLVFDKKGGRISYGRGFFLVTFVTD